MMKTDEELAVEFFKTENPHLKDTEYYHNADKSMTIRAVLYGMKAADDRAIEKGKILGRAEAFEKMEALCLKKAKEGITSLNSVAYNLMADHCAAWINQERAKLTPGVVKEKE